MVGLAARISAGTIALATGLVFTVGHLPAQAATAGKPCARVGATAMDGKHTLICTRVGERLVWRRVASVGGATQSASGAWEWDSARSAWAPVGTPPKCTFPIIRAGALLDFGGAVSIVQPGQSRGTFKPHGGIRWSAFGQYVPGVRITVPFDGVVTRAWHYTMNGTYQFGVGIVSPCGFMVRLGHLLTPSPEFAKILAMLPPAAPHDSRETALRPPVAVKAGTVIATEVGNPSSANPDDFGTFIDFGLLDLRAPNPATASSVPAGASREYASYSVCWYEGPYLAASDRALAAALPFANGDPESVYCRRRS